LSLTVVWVNINYFGRCYNLIIFCFTDQRVHDVICNTIAAHYIDAFYFNLNNNNNVCACVRMCVSNSNIRVKNIDEFYP